MLLLHDIKLLGIMSCMRRMPEGLHKAKIKLWCLKWFYSFSSLFFLQDCSSSEEYSIAAALLPLTTAFYRVSFYWKPLLFCIYLHHKHCKNGEKDDRTNMMGRDIHSKNYWCQWKSSSRQLWTLLQNDIYWCWAIMIMRHIPRVKSRLIWEL